MDLSKREPRGYRLGPRVEVTTRVKPDVHQAIRRIAEERGMSMTRLLADLMEEEVMKAGGAKSPQVA